MAQTFKVGDKVKFKDSTDNKSDRSYLESLCKAGFNLNTVLTVTEAERSGGFIRTDAVPEWLSSMRFEHAHKFNPGDLVVFNGNPHTHSARKGATATVRGWKSSTCGSELYLDVVWDRSNPLRNTQMDGGYDPDDFDLYVKPTPPAVPGKYIVMRDDFADFEEEDYFGPFDSEAEAFDLMSDEAKQGVDFTLFKAVASFTYKQPEPVVTRLS